MAQGTLLFLEGHSSKYNQEVNINVSDDSFMMYAETLSAGRIASNEVFDFDVCILKTRIINNEIGLIPTIS